MANKKKNNGSRPRKRRFYRNQFSTSVTEHQENEPTVPNNGTTSASERKLSTVNNDSIDRSSFEHNTQVDAFVLVNVKLLCEFLISTMRCFECERLGLDCHLSDKKTGFAHDIVISCPFCPWRSSFSTSEDSSVTGHKEVNLRMASFVRSLGRGYSALEKFSLHLNSPKPMTKKSYRSCFSTIREANKKSAEESMKRAVDDVKARSRFSSCNLEAEQTTDCAVSFDGTWQRRGHASHHGVVTAISVDSGKCIDVEVLTNICKQCQSWESRKGTAAYDQFKLSHKCKINHTGSAGAMEAVGCCSIFSRSQENNDLRYTKFLGDGDSSSFKRVVDSKPYDTEIEKLECVGHVQKRVGTRLRKLKSENKTTKLEDGKTLGGLGRLTDKKIDTLQNYYGFAIRQNSGDLEAMKKAVKAVLPHVASTVKNPQHNNCQEAWCGYKTNPEEYRHKNGLPEAVSKFIEPIFEDLAREELLIKCLHGKTQNCNEALNKLIWDRCQKEIYVEKEVIEDAVCSAVSYFNDGSYSVVMAHKHLGLKIGYHMLNMCSAIDSARITFAQKKSSMKQKQRRKTLRAIRKGFQDKAAAKEGDTYTPGGH